MTININTFVRKPFYVQAVEVTAANMAEVAEWCGGEILSEKQGRRSVLYIKVPVVRPMSEKQTKAFAKDLVLKTNTGFKVYTPTSFEACFDPAGKEAAQSEELPFEERETCGKTKFTIDHKPCVLDANHGLRPCSSILFPAASDGIDLTRNTKLPEGYPEPSTR